MICALIAGLASMPSIVPGLAPHTVVLTYHDMVERRDSRALWFDCTPSELVAQLDWMKERGATFISIEQLQRHLQEGAPLPPKSVLITFADNYLGFYRLAWPILRERGIPTVQFVHTDFVGSKQGRPKMTWDQLRELDRSGLVTIASQTRSHPEDLRQVQNRSLKEEFSGSKRALEEQLGKVVHYLAYPNGKYDARVASLAAAAGYRMAFTEAQLPAENSPSIFMVARYVHTRYQEAFR